MKQFFFILLIIVFLPLGIFAQGSFSPFTQELYIPPVLEPEGIIAGVTSYNLIARTGRIAFFGSKETPTLGYNGNYLGPTIRVRRGEKVSIRVDNTLDEPTTVHWHGLIGNTITVNGTVKPYLKVPNALVRFRILNGFFQYKRKKDGYVRNR